jgi:hypothetical protein
MTLFIPLRRNNMGYTHYFTIKEEPPKEMQDKVLRAAKAIVDYAKTELGLAIDDLSDTIININGTPPEDYETFYVDFTELGFGFCKTNLRPYDQVVVAILMAMDTIMGDYVDVSSDGHSKDWQAGQALACEALGTAIDLPSSIPTY